MVEIDKSRQKEVPPLHERIKNSIVAIILGFILIQIIGFWVFPGIGWFGLLPFQGRPVVGPLTQVLKIAVIAYLAICGVMGWFRGTYYIELLKDKISFWKFW